MESVFANRPTMVYVESNFCVFTHRLEIVTNYLVMTCPVIGACVKRCGFNYTVFLKVTVACNNCSNSELNFTTCSCKFDNVVFFLITKVVLAIKMNHSPGEGMAVRSDTDGSFTQTYRVAVRPDWTGKTFHTRKMCCWF